MYIYICIYVCMYVCIYVYMCVCVACVCVCMCVGEEIVSGGAVGSMSSNLKKPVNQLYLRPY